MALKKTKRQQAMQGKVESTRLYPIIDALAIVKECATAKFDESIDVAVQLGIDAKKSDQVVRGAVVMPHGTGKTARVIVFAIGDKAAEAEAAGADAVGTDDLIERIQGGWLDFDAAIATPDTVYLGFGLEGISGAANRNQLMNQVVGYLLR